MPIDSFDFSTVDKRASLLMKRGIGLMQDARLDAVVEALTCFDEALELRSSLPTGTVPSFRYGLAACWMNRAEALTRLGGAERIAAAIHAYDQAILLLRDLPLDQDARFVRRLAIAHQNRGLTLHGQGAPAVETAVADFRAAIAVLEHDHAGLVDDRKYLLAAIWVNLANASVSLDTAESAASAREATLHAIALVADSEDSDANAAEVGIMARHVMCQVAAVRLSSAAGTGGPMPDDVHEATDAADDGLSLARRWEQRGVTRFRDVAGDLFRFGALVYQRYQPQFLGEFVAENLALTRAMAADERPKENP